MNHHAKISVITVCYNASKTIQKTIKSVVNQSYANVEYIIVDGESTDGTLAIVDQFSDQIAVVISEPDNGIYHAMNKGIDSSSGHYLIFLNADDYFFCTSTIENIVKRLPSNESTQIFYGNTLMYDDKSGKGSLWKPKKISGKMLYNSTIPHPSSIFCRSFFENFGHYDDSFHIAGDYEVFVRAYVNKVEFEYWDILIAVFSAGGISTNNTSSEMIKEERENAIRRHFSPAKRRYLKFRVRIKKLLGF